ncbi:hypothetical protein QZH41_011727, partial [Actinostola sp. cb2023]
VPRSKVGVKKAPWVKKETCQHYWYDISKNMNCKDFYPVFIMYNRNRLEGFGWNTNGDLKSPRYEHPTSDRFG